MGILEPITHKAEIEELLEQAQLMYDEAVDQLENQKKKTAKSLEKLGKQKLQSWNGEMKDFLSVFGMFSHVQMVCKMDTNYSFTGMEEEPQQLMVNIEKASLTANEMLKTAAIATSTGALIGIAAYGGAVMFGHASTGTAIATLHGVAKSNAALAWLGGGSLKVGGLGKMGGKLVLSGVVIAPILIVAGLITAAKSKEKLAEAKKTYAEAENAVAQINTIITGMEGIEKMAENYCQFLKKMSGIFRPFIEEMQRIGEDYTPGADGKICFDDLTDVEQRTLHLAWLIAQLEYHSLSVSILTEEGDTNPEGQKALTQVEMDFEGIAEEVAKLNAEKAEIKRLLDEAKNSFATSKENYFKYKNKASNSLISYGKNKTEIISGTFKNYADKIIGYEGFGVNRLISNPLFDGSVEDVNDRINAQIKVVSDVKEVDKEMTNSSYIEHAVFGNLNADPHDISLWLSDEMEQLQSEQLEFSGVSMLFIENTAEILGIITGKESLAEAKEINSDVVSAASLIDKATKAFEAIITEVDDISAAYSKVEKTLTPFIKEIDCIRELHSKEEKSFDAMSEEEQKVYEFAWNLLWLESNALSATIVEDENGLSVDQVSPAVRKALQELKKYSFKMEGVYTRAANIIWKPYAFVSMLIGFVMMGMMFAQGLIQLINKDWFGLAGILGAGVALPIFFYFKELPQSKLFLWRCIRIIVALVVFITVQALGMI